MSSPNTRARLARLISSMISTLRPSRPRAWSQNCMKRPSDDRVVEPAAVARLGPDALHEVLVGVRRVELHQLRRARAAGDEVLGQPLGHVGLAGARRPVEDRLPLALDGAQPGLEVLLGQRGLGGEVVERVGRVRPPPSSMSPSM